MAVMMLGSSTPYLFPSVGKAKQRKTCQLAPSYALSSFKSPLAFRWYHIVSASIISCSTYCHNRISSSRQPNGCTAVNSDYNISGQQNPCVCQRDSTGTLIMRPSLSHCSMVQKGFSCLTAAASL